MESEIQKLMSALHLTPKLLSHSGLSKNLPLATENQEFEAINLFALVAWSIITEPGDSFAGHVREKLGPSRSLVMLINQSSHRQWAYELLGGDDVDTQDQRFLGLEKLIADSLSRWAPRLSLVKTLQMLDLVVSHNLKLLTPKHVEWPKSLDDLETSRPTMLWVSGSFTALEVIEHAVSLVGSRAPTNYGFEVATTMVQDFASSEFAIVSGGAIGIDAISHRAAIAVETPTLAILAGGLDQLYPKTNEPLLHEIIAKYAVISEVPPGTLPTKWRFLQRNRLIAALTKATIVIEAGYRSGAINTANHANELGRLVGAVPGSVFSSSSAGCHRLIKDKKAILVSQASDVISELGNQIRVAEAEPLGISAGNSLNLMPLDLRVYDAIGFRSRSFEQIKIDAGLTSNETMQALASLTLLGLVTNRGELWRKA